MNDEFIARLDADYSRYIMNECDNGDVESDHMRADDLLVELLEELGCHKTVEAYNYIYKYYS